MPISLIKKYKSAAKDIAWQYLFPSSVRCAHPQDGYICRHHIHETAFRKQHRQAVKKSAIHKRVTAHTFRYTFATSYCALALTLERFKNYLVTMM
ncbi:hypothetical protein [Gayadomonas joobiniege]|uniref:hypothetical protein n=1 Tax=Gayadomonas joobiniege TaxID=1234606 RepID=UPI001ED9B92C|nr:hypothetical protein [Gayadomonas joobiniege]